MGNVSGKIAEEIKQFMCDNFLPPPPNRAFYEIMWKNVVQPGRTQVTK